MFMVISLKTDILGLALSPHERRRAIDDLARLRRGEAVDGHTVENGVFRPVLIIEPETTKRKR
jgi:hypothetical protein